MTDHTKIKATYHNWNGDLLLTQTSIIFVQYDDLISKHSWPWATVKKVVSNVASSSKPKLKVCLKQQEHDGGDPVFVFASRNMQQQAKKQIQKHLHMTSPKIIRTRIQGPTSTTSNTIKERGDTNTLTTISEPARVIETPQDQVFSSGVPCESAVCSGQKLPAATPVDLESGVYQGKKEVTESVPANSAAKNEVDSSNDSEVGVTPGITNTPVSEDAKGPQDNRAKLTRKNAIALAIVALILLVPILGIGLGVGLDRGKDDSDDGGDDIFGNYGGNNQENRGDPMAYFVEVGYAAYGIIGMRYGFIGWEGEVQVQVGQTETTSGGDVAISLKKVNEDNGRALMDVSITTDCCTETWTDVEATVGPYWGPFSPIETCKCSYQWVDHQVKVKIQEYIS